MGHTLLYKRFNIINQSSVHVDSKYCPGNVNIDARGADMIKSIQNLPKLLVDSRKVGKNCVLIM